MNDSIICDIEINNIFTLIVQFIWWICFGPAGDFYLFYVFGEKLELAFQASNTLQIQIEALYSIQLRVSREGEVVDEAPVSFRLSFFSQSQSVHLFPSSSSVWNGINLKQFPLQNVQKGTEIDIDGLFFFVAQMNPCLTQTIDKIATHKIVWMPNQHLLSMYMLRCRTVLMEHLTLQFFCRNK